MSFPNSKTIMLEVEPGSVTGEYYVMLANLPFRTSWQELKDWVRRGCDVDHVEVFNGSTTGWVRLMGRENYEKAMAHFKRGHFAGRKVLADGRNSTSKIIIQTVVDMNPAWTQSDVLASQLHGSTSGGGATYWTAAGNSDHVERPSVGHSSSKATLPVASSGEDCSNYMPETQTFQENPYGYPGAPVSQYVYDPQAHPSYGLLGDYASQGVGVDSYGALCETESQFADQAVVYTEPRKIIIKHISHTATIEGIRELVRDAAGSDRKDVQAVEVPTDEQKRLRGHAYATFKNTYTARKVISRLDKLKFEGRTLRVQEAREGVANASVPSTSKSKKEKEKTRTPSRHPADTSSNKRQANHAGKAPVVVDGSTHSRTKTSDKKERSSETK